MEQTRAIEALPWVADGLTGGDGHENTVHGGLEEIALASPQVFWELMRKPWIQSDSVVITVDFQTIDIWLLVYHILPMIRLDEATTLRIIGMPFLEAVDHRDIQTLETLSNLLESDPDGLQRLLSLPTLQDGITDDHSRMLSILRLESVDPEAAAAVRALPWVQDDPENIELLRMLALESKRAFWAWMEQFGDDRVDGAVLERIITIAGSNESAAMQILRMPFLETSDPADLVIVDFLSDLSASSRSELQQILSHPELSEGITDDRTATAALLYLGIRYPKVADAIENVPWVQDGIGAYNSTDLSFAYPDSDEFERDIFWGALSEIQTKDQFVLDLVRKPWFQDGIRPSEELPIYWLFAIANEDTQAAVQILGMQFLETTDPDDAITLETLAALAQENGNLQQFLSNPELQDGIADDQTATVALLYLGLLDPDAAAAIRALSWVQDGIAASEQDDVLALQTLALESEQAFSALMHRAWVHDGVTRDELSVIRFLAAIARESYTDRDETDVVRIIEMSFLDDVDGVDAAAVDALQVLSTQGYLHQVLSHSALQDGITNDIAIVIGVLTIVAERNPDFLRSILTPGQVIVKKRTLALPHSGDVDIAVIHTNTKDPSQASSAMILLEYAIRSHEDFMNTPLPKSYVGLLVGPFGLGEDVPSGVLTIENWYGEFGWLIAHEAAHIYWPFSPRWIAEGAAVFLEGLSEMRRTGVREDLYYDGLCVLSGNLSDLERIELQRNLGSGLADETVYWSICNYVLGSKLFADLYHRLGYEAFQERFRDLYLKMQADEQTADHECTGTERGLCFVKAAFVSDAPPSIAVASEPIINRWYYGSEDGAP